MEKKVKHKLIIAVVLIAVILGINTLFVSSVEPVNASDIALLQLNDTTFDHMVTRGYQAGFKNVLNSGIIPMVLIALISIRTGFSVYRIQTKTKKNKEKETV